MSNTAQKDVEVIENEEHFDLWVWWWCVDVYETEGSVSNKEALSLGVGSGSSLCSQGQD